MLMISQSMIYKAICGPVAELDILWLMHARITLRFFIEKVAANHTGVTP